MLRAISHDAPLYVIGDVLRGGLHALRDVFFADVHGGYFDNGFPEESGSSLAVRLAAHAHLISALNVTGVTSLAHAHPNAAMWALAAALGVFLGAALLCLRASLRCCSGSAATPTPASSTGGDECDDNYFWRNAADARRAAALVVNKVTKKD